MSTQYRIGQLVWAELRGYCPWPARVSVPPPNLEPPEQISNKQHCIYFFGSNKYEWIQESDIKPYEKYQEEMMRYCTINGFMDALNQIVDYMEDPEKFPELGDVEIKEEGDDAMECDYNGYEAMDMDTSVVEQETDKIDESAMPTLQVTLLRVPIYECEDCAVCFLKRREFEHHKLTHIEEMDDQENSTETRKEHDNLNNNLEICDVTENEERTITCNIFDNVIKLKVKKNGRVKVPSTLNPKVPLDRIEARKCDMCDEHFLDPNEYRTHKMSHLERFKVKGDKNKPHKCPKCDARFVLKTTLDVHLIVHDPFKFTCHCGIGYYRFVEYKGHRKVVHNETVQNSENVTEVKPIQEDEEDWEDKQNKEFKYRANGEDKIVKTKLGQIPRLKITLAGKGIKRKAKKKSRRKIRRNQKTFLCTLCGKTYRGKNNLQVHQVVHTKEKPYPCNQCGKRFTQPGALKIHLKRHTGNRDVACQYCPKTFYDIGTRNLHERTHTGTKPYRCDHCGKEFTDPSSYGRHLRTHTGEKRYKCKLCSKRYTESGPLQRHIITVHDKSRAVKCKICSKSFCFPFEVRKHVKIEHAEEDSD